MLALLPLLAGLAVFSAARRRSAEGSRRSILLAAAVLGVVGTAGSELLSALGLFSRAGAAALWTATAVVAAVSGIRASARSAKTAAGEPIAGAETGLIAGSAAIGLAVGVTAWAAAPSTRDALSYHLPRAMHWIQNGSLAHYPTAILRQLTLPPGAELLLAQARLLAGSDRPLALLQWFAWIGGLVAASAVAEELGAKRTGRIAAVIFAATLPMAILQGSSVQNDLVAAFWLLSFAYFVLRHRTDAKSRSDAAAAGATLGLAVLTKPTAWLFAAPFAIWLAASLLARRRARAVPVLLGIAAIAAAPNMGWILRNRSLFGSFPGATYGAANETHAPAAVASNVARNLALHLAAPSETWNRAVEKGVVGFDRAIGADPNDPRTTWKGAEFHVPPGLRGAGRPDPDEILFLMLHEDQAGAPLHLLLAAAAVVAVLASGSLRRRPALVLYACCVVAGALLFCGAFKWQPWSARLQLPLFLLAGPLAAAALTSEARPRAVRVACAALLVAAVPWALANATRPLAGVGSVLAAPRFDQSFATRPDLEAPLKAAASDVARRRCDRVAVELSPDDPEYLVWIALQGAGVEPRIEHARVANASGALAREERFATFRPCATIRIEVSRVEVGGAP